jgi:hypothetical protein
MFNLKTEEFISCTIISSILAITKTQLAIVQFGDVKIKPAKEKMGILDKLLGKKKIDFPPKPKWKPNLPINHTEIVEKAK